MFLCIFVIHINDITRIENKWGTNISSVVEDVCHLKTLPKIKNVISILFISIIILIICVKFKHNSLIGFI